MTDVSILISLKFKVDDDYVEMHIERVIEHLRKLELPQLTATVSTKTHNTHHWDSLSL